MVVAFAGSLRLAMLGLLLSNPLGMPDDSPLVGHRLADVTWPEDVVLVAILRHNSIQTPDPDRSLEAGDELLFVCAETSEDALSQLLSPKN